MLCEEIVQDINRISLQLNLGLLDALLAQAFLLSLTLLFKLVCRILVALLLNLIDNRIGVLDRDKVLHHSKTLTDNIEHLGNTLTFLRHCFLCQFSFLDKLSGSLVKSIVHSGYANIKQQRLTCIHACLIRFPVGLHRIFRIRF